MLESYYINNEDCESIEDVLLKNKLDIHCRLVEVIDIGFNAGVDKIQAFTILDPTNRVTEFVFEIEKGNWNEILDTSMDYFLELEDYDNCSYIRDLKERINTDFTGHPDVD
tara:strand:+ start:2846 stop:3178 length:333 start_codon:yes stop_codon:yes gene_type:complete